MHAWSLLKSSLALAVLLLAGVDVSWASSRVALVVGSSDYRHAPAIPHALKDAADIAAAFERLGFTTIRVLEPSFDELRLQFSFSFTDVCRAAFSEKPPDSIPPADRLRAVLPVGTNRAP